jgi:hypothetical protein
MSRKTIAQTPPMGWNSFDAYATNVDEAQVRGNAEYMAENLADYGWNYVVIDARWYDPVASKAFLFDIAPFEIDGFGRPLPAINRFPSSVDGSGFLLLARDIHAMGLKFGIHIMRGVPRVAAHLNSPILDTGYSEEWKSQKLFDATVGARTGYLGAAGIADGKNYTCDFCQDMYGVLADRPGAYEWYRSLISQYADWGIDFIKVDNISKKPYSDGEIELLRRAIDDVGAPMVLSLSPGGAPLEKAEHLKAHADMWRISSDFWDNWEQLHRAFELTASWAEHAGPGHWPDADMLPLGRIAVSHHRQEPRRTRFSEDEQITLVTLWSIARSPLILGGQLWDNTDWDLSLLTNREVLALNQEGKGQRELSRSNSEVIWRSTVDGRLYLALFCVGEHETQMRIDHKLASEAAGNGAPINGTDGLQVYDVWGQSELGSVTPEKPVELSVPSHGARLVRLEPSGMTERAGSGILRAYAENTRPQDF